MKANIFRFSLLILVFSLILTGCDVFQSSLSTPTVDLAATQTQYALRTEAAVTVEAAMTESAAIDTPAVEEPSATPRESPTEAPTPTASATVLIVDTPTPTITNTPEPTATLLIPTMTTAPVEYKCNLVRTSPYYKAFLDRGEEFDVHWVLENSGTETWYTEFVSGRYRNGAELHSYGDTFNLTAAVEPGETYEVIIDMQAPPDPGEYSAIWILERKDKAFCWFSVDIVVK